MAHEGYLESISKRQPCVIEFSSCCMLPQNRKKKIRITLFGKTLLIFPCQVYMVEVSASKLSGS